MSNVVKRDRQPRHLKVEVMPTLLELAVTANEEHAACEAILEPALRGALSHAIMAGEALIAARQQTEVGDWRRWLQENFDGSYAAANRYARIAAYKHLVADTNGVKDALEALHGMPDALSRAGAKREYSDDMRTQALNDLRSGATMAEVAESYGVSITTVARWKNPEANREHRRRWHKKRREAARLLAEQEEQRKIKRAVRKAGAALSEAYAIAERMQGVLAQAIDEATDDESRAALERAGEPYRKMRDEIVRALGVS